MVGIASYLFIVSPLIIYLIAVDGVSLKEGSLLVDVGGGAGFATLVLYKAYPHLKYVVQDLPTQNEAAKEVGFSPHTVSYLS